MIDLKSCTFIIPVRIESEDRMRNVITVLCYILENFDTKVILKEVDTESVFRKKYYHRLKIILVMLLIILHMYLSNQMILCSIE